MIRHFNYVVQQAWLKLNESKCCIVKKHLVSAVRRISCTVQLFRQNSWEWCKVPSLIKRCTHTAFWDPIPLYPSSAVFSASHKKSYCTNNTGSPVTETGDSLKLLFVTREKREREQLGSFPGDRHSCYLQLVVVFKYSHI